MNDAYIHPSEQTRLNLLSQRTWCTTTRFYGSIVQLAADIAGTYSVIHSKPTKTLLALMLSIAKYISTQALDSMTPPK